MKKHYKVIYFVIFTILCSLSVICCPYAEVPNEITYTGRLREFNQPITGTRTMNFRIYNAAINGSNVWSDDGVSVNVKGGVFTHKLTPNVDWRVFMLLDKNDIKAISFIIMVSCR